MMTRSIDEKMPRDDGFSSVEILVSMLVLAVVSLGITNSTMTSIQTNRASQRKAVAVNLGHQVLECVKSQIEAGRPIDASNAGVDCNPSGAPAGYTLVIPAPIDGTGAFAGMTRVQATISWTSPLPDRIRLDSYVDS